MDEEQSKKVRQLVSEQTKEWSQLISQNIKEEHELLKVHCSQQCDLIKRLLELAQAQQVKDVENKHQRSGRRTLIDFVHFSVDPFRNFIEISNNWASRPEVGEYRLYRVGKSTAVLFGLFFTYCSV